MPRVEPIGVTAMPQAKSTQKPVSAKEKLPPTAAPKNPPARARSRPSRKMPTEAVNILVPIRRTAAPEEAPNVKSDPHALSDLTEGDAPHGEN